MGEDSTNGLMAGAMTENGRTITCMGRESTPGRMVGGTMESTTMTGNTDLVYIPGRMGDST